MPYLPFDLDAKQRAALIARGLGMDPRMLNGGLLDLWDHVWRTKQDVVSELYLVGCVGTDQRLPSALIEGGFLEAAPNGFRVRGAKKWLFAMEAKTRAGKVRAAGAQRDESGRLSSTQPAPSQHVLVPPSSTQPALTPSIQHPAPKDLKTPRAKAAPDPRHAPMVKKLVEASPGYAFGGRDAKGLSEMLGKGSDEEILARWRRALGRTGFPLVRAVHELATNWNHFAADSPPARPKDFTRGMVRADDVDKKSFEQTGVLDGF
jgi:hypothetical protein